MGCLRVSVKNVNALNVSVRNMNELNVSATLICSTGPDVWEYFNVGDEPLMVEEGFFKVYKSE